MPTIQVVKLVEEAQSDQELRQALIADHEKVARERHLSGLVTGAASRALILAVSVVATAVWI